MMIYRFSHYSILDSSIPCQIHEIRRMLHMASDRSFYGVILQQPEKLATHFGGESVGKEM